MVDMVKGCDGSAPVGTQEFNMQQVDASTRPPLQVLKGLDTSYSCSAWSFGVSGWSVQERTDICELEFPRNGRSISGRAKHLYSHLAGNRVRSGSGSVQGRGQFRVVVSSGSWSVQGQFRVSSGSVPR